ncbi:hypothetical protein C0J52_21176 [Blattella germanica]|nr:hypothetical protein C0J52_21176 [Blattella germanica]
MSFKFLVTVQRRFRDKYGREAPDRHTIVQWHKHLLENGDFQRHGGSGRKRTSDENVEAIREAFTRSPMKSVRQASLDDDNEYLNNVIFSDETTIHVSGYVNCHNCRIWGSENSHVFLEHE